MIDEKKVLIQNLLKNGSIQSEKVQKAMETVEREEFIPKNMKKYAYLDRPLPLSKGQTISAPHMVAFICEKLEIKDGMNILEIGTGFGYNAAVISEIMNKKGHVYSIERIESLAKTAINNLKRNGYRTPCS